MQNLRIRHVQSSTSCPFYLSRYQPTLTSSQQTSHITATGTPSFASAGLSWLWRLNLGLGSVLFADGAMREVHRIDLAATAIPHVYCVSHLRPCLGWPEGAAMAVDSSSYGTMNVAASVYSLLCGSSPSCCYSLRNLSQRISMDF